ncbi:MAG: tyrosine--tRNA ligase [Oscillospiraceae bacterium]|jgi:tyrosyl-tRNA synthetase|nr:tyrosine--tRNA ligase [Oscillospiraceae bacterium]
MTVYEELTARGLVAQTTNEEEIKELIDSGKAVFYIGFDPTADSLHVGHLLQLIVMRHLQRANNKAIALLGGGTTMVGDPSGRSDMRSMLTQEEIQRNADRFKGQMSKIVNFEDGGAVMINNADWLLKLNYIEFLRDIGVHFSVNRMLTAECFKTRLEKGLSFIEFNYMLMQSYDFYVLNERYGVNMQCGGDDQWSNIINGADLIRRKNGNAAYGITFTLLLTSDGKKMGKTQKGAVWLDPEKVPPYEFFQYWRNIDDADVINCMKRVTFMPLEEIKEFEKLEGAELNSAKERLAYEVTRIVHGEEAANQALASARAVFSAGASENMPETELASADFTGGGIAIADLLVRTGLAPSKGEARRLVDQGGISVNDEKVTSAAAQLGEEMFAGNGVILKKGKKVYHRAKIG